MRDQKTGPLAVGVVPMETRRPVIVRLAQRAEELGYTGFFVAEGWGHDATALLAEIAVRTSTIAIGSNVLNVWGRSPATIAMSAASLAEISGGRYILGLGAGSPALAEGLDSTPFHEPVRRLETVTTQVRRLLDGQCAEPARGSTVAPLRLAITPASRVPIAVAALGPRALTVAGRLADAWTPFFLPRRKPARGHHHSPWRRDPGSPGGLGPGARHLARHLGRRRGRPPPGQVHRGLVDRLLSHQNGTDVSAAVAPAGFRQFGRRGGSRRERATASQEVDVLVEQLTLSGTPAQARAGINSWFTAGADMPCLVLPPNADPTSSMRSSPHWHQPPINTQAMAWAQGQRPRRPTPGLITARRQPRPLLGATTAHTAHACTSAATSGVTRTACMH